MPGLKKRPLSAEAVALDLPAVLDENRRRNRILFEHYNPITGEAAVGPRFDVTIAPGLVWRLPETMRQLDLVQSILEAGSLHALAELLDLAPSTMMAALRELRIDHDFEFWCALCVTIETKKDGNRPFVLNRPQRKLLREYERQRLAGLPIRVVLLKARQWGGSTCTQLYMAWIQLRHKRNWNAFVCALDKGQAIRIRSMYALMASYYPADVGTVSMVGYGGHSNVKWIRERECIMGVASVERPDAVRSYTYQMLHLSEVGLWPSTEKVNAESFAQGLAGALVNAPYTFCCLESTAKGVGNFFHRVWQRAEKGVEAVDEDAAGDPKGRYAPVFVAWFDSEEYVSELGVSPEQFIGSMSEYDWTLWELGATLEQINWYRLRQEEPGMDDEWRMRSEFPSTADEAFQSSGRRYFPKAYVLQARQACEKPRWIGNLDADAQLGRGALANIRFHPGPRGFVRVWTPPGKSGLERPGYRYTNRYAAFADVGGTTEKADYSTVKVIDRIMTLWGGVPQVCAVWHGHLDQDLFAWEAARLAKWYHNALLAVEINSLDRDGGDEVRGREADHSYTVLDEIVEHYDNLFYRTEPEKDFDRYRGLVGFQTNKKTKPMILNALKAALRDGLYEEREQEACDEFDMYEVKPNGSFGAVAGQHDDRVITTAGAVWLALKHMDPVREVPRREASIIKTASAARF